MEDSKLKPSYDTRLTICTAESRKSKQWTNKQVRWSKLLNRCSQTTRTNETLVQYLEMSKEEQTKIKDKGGFVGGQMANNGRRTKDSIVSRQLITLDADDVESGRNIWEDFKKEFPQVAACIYSTHKHRADKPRLRFVIPLSEPTNIEQWEAAARYMAGRLDIKQFDPTTFQYSRLMFWPSTAKDAEFYFQWQDGEIINVQDLLDEYDNWQDVESWPRHPKEAPETILCNKRKAPDPTAKNGVVGAFCNAYPIKDAIDTFLTDVYEPTEKEDRYTYKNGSTFGGLVVYKDGYAFSNHSTDPAHRDAHGCNAFDLVRIHKFGDLDTDKDPNTPVCKLPSYKAMESFALKQPNVSKYLAKSITQNAQDDFEGISLEDNNGEDWRDKLTFNKKLEVEATPTNIIAILLNDPELKKIKFDMFRNRDITFSESFINTQGNVINDESAGKICLYLFEKWKINLSQKKVYEYLLTTSGARGFNPVQDFIKQEQWDGTERIETALIDYLGAADTPLNRAITKKWFVGAVARVFEPGCKFDYVLTVPGAQGIGKSTFFSVIGSCWFSDSFSFASKDTAKFEAVIAAWIVEIGELNGLKKLNDAEAAKQFLSKTVDTYRAAYAKAVNEYKRHCVFAATTNEEYFLPGYHGNRRWWIVKAEGKGVVSSWIDELKSNVPQMWAEAYQCYKHGEELFLTPELEAEANKVQFEYGKDGGDDLLPVIESFLKIKLPTDWESKSKEERRQYFRYMSDDPLNPSCVMSRDKVSAEVIVNELNDDRVKKYSSQRINALLERCEGWEICDKKLAPGACYARTRKVFVRIEEPPEDDI